MLYDINKLFLSAIPVQIQFVILVNNSRNIYSDLFYNVIMYIFNIRARSLKNYRIGRNMSTK